MCFNKQANAETVITGTPALNSLQAPSSGMEDDR
jgi:hypothetical protein